MLLCLVNPEMTNHEAKGVIMRLYSFVLVKCKKCGGMFVNQFVGQNGEITQFRGYCPTPDCGEPVYSTTDYFEVIRKVNSSKDLKILNKNTGYVLAAGLNEEETKKSFLNGNKKRM